MRNNMGGIALITIMLMVTGQPFIARAEKNDRLELLNYEADKQAVLPEQGEIKSVLLEGDVMITQGTMRIKASKVILKQDKDGKRYGDGFGAPAFFTQTQEGRAHYLEAVGERLEFDERTNTVKLFTNAKLKLAKDELSAEYIVYNTLTERYEAAGVAPGAKLPASMGSAGRVRGVLYPKLKDPAAATPAVPSPAPAKPN